MPDEIHIKVGGAWKALDELHTKVSGAWKAVDEAYTKVAGTWQQVWPIGVLALPVSQEIDSNDLTTQAIDARLLIDEDGGYRRYRESGGTPSTADFGAWWSEHPDSNDPGDNYHVRISHQTGNNRMLATDMLDTVWESIATDRIAYFRYDGAGGPNNDISTYLVEFSTDGGSTTEDSYTLTITLTNQSP